MRMADLHFYLHCLPTYLFTMRHFTIFPLYLNSSPSTNFRPKQKINLLKTIRKPFHPTTWCFCMAGCIYWTLHGDAELLVQGVFPLPPSVGGGGHICARSLKLKSQQVVYFGDCLGSTAHSQSTRHATTRPGKKKKSCVCLPYKTENRALNLV